jgi:hypothetical protein
MASSPRLSEDARPDLYAVVSNSADWLDHHSVIMSLSDFSALAMDAFPPRLRTAFP